MSERWRRKLGDLDKVGPDDEVFDRAQIGPQYPEDPIERPSTGARVVTAVAAFTVFALAIAVFAIPALRLKEGTGKGIGDSTMLPLWPAQTLEEAQAIQADADAGGGAIRYTDPERAAEIFGHNVLGWSDLTIDDGNTQQGLIADDYPPCRDNFPSGGNSICYGLNPTQSGEVSTGYTYSGPTSGPSTETSSPFRVYALYQSPVDKIPVTVTLFQPIREGVGGVWMVVKVDSMFASLSLDLGSSATVGDLLAARATIMSDRVPTLGIRVGDPDSECTALAISRQFIPATIDAGSGSTGQFRGLPIPQPVDPDGQPCEGPQPAYAFVASLDVDTRDVSLNDPFAAGANSAVDFIAAIPFTVLDNQAEPTAAPTEDLSEGPPTIGPSPGETPTAVGGLAKYQTQGLGHFSFDVPTGWTALDFSTFDGRVTFTGTIVSNVNLNAPPGPMRDDPRTISLSDAEVRLTLEHRDGGPAPDLRSDDHDYPLQQDQATAAYRGSWEVPFRVNGHDWVARLEVGPDVPMEAADAMDRVTGSLTFPSLEAGDQVDGWSALFATNKQVSWQNISSNVIVVMESGQGHIALDTLESCGEGQNMTSDAAGNAIIECPDGSVIGYSVDGQPLPGNPAGYRDPLDVHPVITAWNGRLLTQLGGTVAVAV